nr:MAG TPA: hypothetical protein [Caudoviricetes sp.]
MLNSEITFSVCSFVMRFVLLIEFPFCYPKYVVIIVVERSPSASPVKELRCV